MSCENIPSITDLEKTKLHIDDFGRLMGTGTGTSTNGVTGQVRPTYNKVIADMGFKQGSGDFTTGFTVAPGQRDYAWYDPVSHNWYSYLGAIPTSGYVVVPGTNPVGNDDWKPVTDELLRSDLANVDSTVIIAGDTASALKRKANKVIHASEYGFNGTTTDYKTLLKQFMAEPKNKVIDVDIYTSGVAAVADNTKVTRHKGAVIYALGDVTTDPDANANNQGQVLEAGNNTTFTGVKIDGQGFKGNGIFNGAKTNVTIQLCDLSNGTGQAIADVGGVNSKYYDNDLYKCLHGVQMWLTNGARVRGNHVYQVTGGIWTAVGRDVLAWGNIIHDCGDLGLDWEGGQNCHSFNNEIWACAHGELAIFQTGPELVGEGIVMGNLSHNNNKIKRFATRLNETGVIVQNDLDDVGAITIYGLDASLAGPIEIKNNTINVESATGDHPLSLRSVVVRATANANTEYLDISDNDIYTNYSLAFTMGRVNKLRFADNLIVFKQTNPINGNEIKNTNDGIISGNEFRVLDNLTPPSSHLILLSTDSAVTGRLRVSDNKFSNCGITPIKIDQAVSNRNVNISRNSLFETSPTTGLAGSSTGGIEVLNGGVVYDDQDLTFAIGDNEVFNLASKSALGRSQASAIGHVSMQMGGVGPMYRVAVQTRIGTVEMAALDNGGAINTGIFPNPARYVTFGATTVQPQDTDGSGGTPNSAVLHLKMNSRY